jgi:hypothetical protein
MCDGIDCHTPRLTQENVMELLAAALKYQLLDLVSRAVSFIEKKLSLDNCFQILIEADRLQARAVKDKAARFITRHWKVLGR